MNSVPSNLDQKVALALARATAALSATAATGHHVDFFNTAAVGPAAAVIFVAPAFTTTTGHVRITLYFTVNANGGTLVVGDSVSLFISQDGSPIAPPSGPTAVGVVAHANELGPGGLELSLAFEISTDPGSTHVWGGEMLATGAHTFGAVNPGWLNVLIQELP